MPFWRTYNKMIKTEEVWATSKGTFWKMDALQYQVLDP